MRADLGTSWMAKLVSMVSGAEAAAMGSSFSTLGVVSRGELLSDKVQNKALKIPLALDDLPAATTA